LGAKAERRGIEKKVKRKGMRKEKRKKKRKKNENEGPQRLDRFTTLYIRTQ
jgi:hypothetical protein